MRNNYPWLWCCFFFVRQCYNLEPLKKDVARQVTYGKDSFKICKLLEKKNPDFCSMRYRTFALLIRHGLFHFLMMNYQLLICFFNEQRPRRT